MQDFKKLQVWQKAHALTLNLYKATKFFPSEEKFGLTSQLRRAVASIPANVAEGCGRSTGMDFARFLQMAMGSACEVEYHLLLANDLDYLAETQYNELNILIVEIKRMLAALIGKVRQTKN